MTADKGNLSSKSPFNSNEMPKKGMLDMNKEMFDLEPFREAAKYFEQHGHYPFYTTSDDIAWIDRSPNSKFTKYWKEEHRRCVEGVTIGRNYLNPRMYHHLNYNRIWKIPELTEAQQKAFEDEGGVEVDRVLGFPDPWDGAFHTMNYISEAKRRGMHAGIFKSRGQGVSYELNSEANRIYHHIDGGKVFVIAPSKAMLEDTDYILFRIWENMDFITKYTPFFRIRQGGKTDTILVRKSKKSESSEGKKVASDAEEVRTIQGLIATAGKQFRGPRGNLIIFDEGGVNKAIDTLVSVSRPSVEQNKFAFGQIIVAGTGGSKLADLAGFSHIMKNPGAYNFLGVKNVFSKIDNGKEICFFLGAYWNNTGFFNKKGISDINAAYAHELKEREMLAAQVGKSHKNYSQYVAERAMFPREALMNTHSSNMPIELINNQIDAIEGKELDAEVGRMDLSNIESGIFLPDKTREPYNVFPAEGKHSEGAVVIFHRPVEGHKYVAGIDPYAHDKSNTASHGAMYVWDVTADRLVAAYVGRAKTTTEFYKITIAIGYMYDLKKGILVENNIYEFNSVYKSHKAFKFLANMPSVAKAIVPNMKASVTNRIGMIKNVKIYNISLNILAEWLQAASADDPTISNIQTIKDLGLLRELASAEEELNFDRLNAMSQLIMLREEERVKMKLNRDREATAHKTSEYLQHLQNLQKR